MEEDTWDFQSSKSSGEEAHVLSREDEDVYAEEDDRTRELTNRLRRNPPKSFESFRRKDEIELFRTHKKFLKKIEKKKEIVEPLTGFSDKQKEIDAMVFKPFYFIPDVTDPICETPRKSWFLKQRTIKIEVQPKGKVLEMESTSASIVKPKKIPTFVCQLELIREAKANPSTGFHYMIYAVDRSSEYFNPYALKVVPYKEVDKVYMTIGINGVTQYSPSEMTFTPIERWEREYRTYLLLTKIRTFEIFRKWKAFYTWRKTVKYIKISKATNYMNKNLFFCDTMMCKALFDIRAMCSTFLNASLVDISNVEKLPLFTFVEMQLAKLEFLKDKLDEYRRQTVAILNVACLNNLAVGGFTPDDSNITIEQTALGKKGGKIRMPKDGILKMSYIEQAKKRERCSRVSCFIHVVDYYQLTMRQLLLRNTYTELLEILEDRTMCLPPEEEYENPNVNYTIPYQKPNGQSPKPPYISVDVLINPKKGGIDLDPSEEVFWHVINTLQKMWEENLEQIHPFLSDEFFYPFTRPLINNKREEPTCGEPPDMMSVFREDPIMTDLINRFENTLKQNFAAMKKYCKRFQHIYDFYDEDMNFDENIIRQNEKCDIMRKWSERYRSEEEEIGKVVPNQRLGIFFVQFERLKISALPAPNQKQLVLAEIMPILGRARVNALEEEATKAIKFLESDPISTEDYVEYIKFIDQAQQKVDNMESQLDFVKELYDIMEEYKITVPTADLANYLGISVHFTSLRLSVEKRLEERIKLITRFNAKIQKDINVLTDKIQTILEEATEPWLLEPVGEASICLETLKDLNERLIECSNLASDYRSHQKTFKVEMTRFEILEQVTNEVRLRILLWESLEVWDRTVVTWYEAPFETLNVEELSAFVTKNQKSVVQLEKGLPENLILPELKEKVDIMKDKLPTIGCLRNPNLLPRHWAKIEGLLNYKFDPEDTLTLQELEKLGVFNYPDELLEISSAASSEAGLEAMLKKIDAAWKTLDFIVMPHKETKDIFVLGSLEEVQATLDDSNINIQTIAASRHVAAVKPKVDDWLKRLDLFSKTLEAWQYCQQQWVYLEAIFSAPDIQRQLPVEAKLFIVVDKSWKEIMRKTYKMPLALENCTSPGLYEQFRENNRNLDQILKCLEAYLETKRIAFPRFFFLSNDELLEILAQTRNPHAVQRHLQKCFDAIFRLEFAPPEIGAMGQEKLSNEIMAMISPEGERVELGKGLKARGNVEDWLGKVEASMFSSLKKRMKEAIIDYGLYGRQQVLENYPSQVVLTVSQIYWAKDVHYNLESGDDALSNMKEFERKCYENLNELAAMVRGELPKLIRDVIINLITVDVHARDTISILVANKVSSSSSFDWMKALRYYWEETVDNCIARMSNSEYTYGYEYLGAQRRLVITPLTDKCYLCLMGALQLDLGGAPAGPAGTGKTETTKDLGKALAIQCVVFNCSEGLDYKMMGRFFSGLATSGAWCCFDEFNRIDIEVLSVIAQQLITIRNAKVLRAKEFMFEGRKIKLVRTCAAFITMNPGYAGRTELPDNLKSLFRPVSMMVPDYKLIAEVTLYSEGFESSKPLSVKMTLMYTLCSEQLSQQDHYDFGMRAVKSVLVMAGSLKRDNPDKKEDVVLIRALRDSNLPKFLADDAELFQGILGDLFPGVVIPEEDYGVLQQTAVNIMKEAKLQPEACSIRKVIQLHETMRVRHGVMLVGPTGAGKSTVLRTLRDTYTRLAEMEIPSPYYRKVHMYVMNPKAVTIGELYGEVHIATSEWHDGLLGIIIRRACASMNDDHQWVVCDGPVDAVWIENMNTVLDDNKMLCLANSERIKLTPYVHMIFEVGDLAQASPATVSRCGMVYLDPTELKWLPRVKTWIAGVAEILGRKDVPIVLLDLFEKYVEKGFKFFRKYCDYAISQVDISKADMLCAILESILLEPGAVDKKTDSSKVKIFITQAFVFSYIWAIGGNTLDDSRDTFEMFVKDQFENHPDAKLASAGDLWGLFINVADKRMDIWTKIMPAFVYDPLQPFFEILVPTEDTVRFGYIMEKLIRVNKPILFTGGTGVGKSVIAKMVLTNLENSKEWMPIILNFSAQTSSGRTQEILELKLEKKKKTVLGAPVNKRVCVFVDDVNMPKLDTYGAQPPIELLRQILDSGGFYDRDKLFWKYIQDVVMSTACAPPGGGRNPLTARFVRHFAMLVIPSPTEDSLKSIFKSIVKGFFKDFTQPIMKISDKIVGAAIEVYQKIAEDLLPTPEKSHYIFNLRDLSKCIQGILQADNGVITEAKQMMRLFYHECLRVFHDRLINVQDKSYFYRLLTAICSQTFGDNVITLPDEEIISPPPLLLFGDFMEFGADREDRVYEEIVEIKRAKHVLQEYLEDYCLVTSKEMNLIFFMDAMEHLCRLARILRSERGNGLLVGVGGMGKQSLTKLASHMNGYRCHQIEVSRGYDKSSWQEDLRRFYLRPGAFAEPATFLFTDTQIVLEEFLEDINNTLNSGEVPNLFEAEELERAIIATRPAAKDVGIDEGNRDGIYQFFIGRVRNHLHLMLCMSPVGDAFRRRCRMFPSLVNCCTIDWYSKWPDEALLSVAIKSIGTVISDDDKARALASVCVAMHQSVEDATVKFFEEMRRRYYTTPSSYLDLLKLYLSVYGMKANKIENQRNRIANGLNKLKETNEMVVVMKEQLIILGPQLKINSEEVAKLMVVVEKEKAAADKVRVVVAADEKVAKEKANETAALEADARQDLEAALPALEEAQNALAALNKNDINEIKVFNKPPQLVRFVMEAVCLLLGEKTDWPTAKAILGDVHFLERLMAYQKDDISDKLLKKLQQYVGHKDFVPEIVAKQSKVCKSMCIWVVAIDGYAKISRIVGPKRQRLQEAAIELQEIEAILKTKQKALADVERQIKNLQNQYDGAVKRLADLEYTMVLSEARLGRSGRLTAALADEEVRWIEQTAEFDKVIGHLPGDTLVAAGGLAYLGAFTSIYREQLLNIWLSRCAKEKIEISENFSLINVLADPYEIRMWNTFGLPRDHVSTENAILVTQAGRWPLMIDPQEQANRWIRSMEMQNGLKMCKLTDPIFMRIMEACIRTGAPILLQEVGETLDPSLEPILLKQTFSQGGRTVIRLGDNDVEYDANFRLYITTKMANPHYLPEICIKVTIVNFTVTPSGLEDQLLAEVVRLEKPELEKMRNELIAQINYDKAQLQSIEDKILTLLFSSEGNILDNEELIETLNESNETSAIIATRLVDSEATELEISVAREKYRSVATRGSVLYFVVANLAIIDPMYQFSLKYFNQIVNNIIENSEKTDDLLRRLEILHDEITLAVFTNVSRGLFERHKIVFSFMINIAILLNDGVISYAQWNFVLRGPERISVTKKPDHPTLSESMWTAANYLERNFKSFEKLMDDILKKIVLNLEYYEEEINILPNNNAKADKNWDETLSDIEKLMLLKALKEEKLVFGITAFVQKNLGHEFVESPIITLQVLYPNTSKVTPLVFVLSTGSDPFSAFLKFATEMGFADKYESISLGQGQGPIAEGLIRRGMEHGYWIFLQNCHLATSWMLSLENLAIEIAEDPEKVDNMFRLFLSSMPSAAFPVSVLQNSVKVTNEPPKGLKANVKRAFFEMEEEFFEQHELGEEWRRMIFGVCFFHAIIQERKKFGPLGWNIIYEFSDSDRECCLLNLKMFCVDDEIPWDALIYTTGEITYGGRITDNWDLRCLKTILEGFFSPKTLKSDYAYSPSGTYYCPSYESLAEFREFIDGFPIIEDPEIFGMHENANIAFQLKESKTVLATLMEVQPKVGGSKAGRSESDIAYELADSIMEKIALKIDIDICNPRHLKKDSAGRLQSLTVVLLHEVERYNILLTKIHSSMENLQRAIKGFVVMSEELENVFKSLVNNQVPQIWHNTNVYPSLKTLGNWIKDLVLRIDFIQVWLEYKKPISFWLSGLSFPQGFITGMLQTHARKYNIPIDHLKLDFKVTDVVLDQEDIQAAHLAAGGKEVSKAYKNLEIPDDGVFAHGLFIDAGKWDPKFKILVDANKGEMNPSLPVIQIMPVLSLPTNDPRYVCPLYKTSIRAGVLSTTGHSTNFVMPVLIPSARQQSYWIMKGTALLVQVTN